MIIGNMSHTFLSRDFTNTLRGIAILLVIVGHIVTGGFHNRYFTPLGAIGVTMFLFLSGYGLTESYKKNGLHGFWKKKLVRILIPYLIWIPIYHMAIKWSPLGNGDAAFIPRYWFLEYLIICYLVFYLSYRFFPQKAVPLMVVVSIISFFVMGRIQSTQSMSFVLGVIVSQQKDYFSQVRLIKYQKAAVFLSVIGVIALALRQIPAIRSLGEDNLSMKILQLFQNLSFAISIIIALYSLKYKGNRYLATIGTVSYELYLVHMSFYGLNSNYSLICVFIVQTIILAYAVHQCNLWVLRFFCKDTSTH